MDAPEISVMSCATTLAVPVLVGSGALKTTHNRVEHNGLNNGQCLKSPGSCARRVRLLLVLDTGPITKRKAKKWTFIDLSRNDMPVAGSFFKFSTFSSVHTFQANESLRNLKRVYRPTLTQHPDICSMSDSSLTPAPCAHVIYKVDLRWLLRICVDRQSINMT